MVAFRLAVQHEPRGKRKPNAGRRPFFVPETLERADAIMAGPSSGFAPRVAGRGELVQRFVLPLELCKTTNALISMVGGRGRGPSKMSGAAKAAKFKNEVFGMMWIQHPFVRPEPLRGRAFLRAVRFTTKEPDATADSGMKTAIDCLRVPVPPAWDARKNAFSAARKGLGFLVDDAQRFVEIVSWWEKAPPGYGFGLLEVWTG